MLPKDTYYILYSNKDLDFATNLATDLRKHGLNLFFDRLDLLPGMNYSENILSPFQPVILLLSPAGVADESVLEQIAYARKYGSKIFPVLIRACDIPSMVQFLMFVDFTGSYREGFDELLTSLQREKSFPQKSVFLPGKSDGCAAAPTPLPRQSKSKNSIVKEIINAINPFRRKEQLNSRELENSMPLGSSKEAGNVLRSRDNVAVSGPAAAALAPAPKLSNYTMGGVALPERKPPNGKVLYDIPEKMMVNRQHKCIVRIGENEAIVKDDDTFSDAVKIETIPISGVMKVDLIDISEQPKFMIKTINSAEQEVEDGSYTEWLFWVTPLTDGMFPLILKVSILKMVDGRELRKELVFEQSVIISADQKTTMQPLVSAPTGSQIPSAVQPALKDLLNEKKVIEVEPPIAFISYAHKDKTYFDIFIDYLKAQSGWTIWTDRNIEIGSDWFQRIRYSVNQTDIAVLLISADFISSAFIKEHEFEKFSELKAEKPTFNYLPILLRDVDFTRWEDLAAMQLFVAYGDEYGVPEKKGQMIPFAKLCRFDVNGQLIPNDNLDTYFKNMVKKAEKDWVKTKLEK